MRARGCRDKFFSVVEEMLPASGFVNGCAFPTVADLAVLCMTDMAMPMGVAKQLAGGFPMVSLTACRSTTTAACC